MFRRTHTFLLALVLCAAPHVVKAQSYSSTVLADNPTAYYRLGEAPGASAAVDSSGNSHAGTYGSNPTLGTAGLVQGTDTSVNFNSSGYVSIPDASALNFVNSAFTIEAWVNTPGIPSGFSRRIFDKAAAGEPRGYGLDMHSGAIRLLGSVNYEVPYAFASNTTYHIVATSTGTGTGTFYINGVLIGSGAYSSSQAYTGAAHIATSNRDDLYPGVRYNGKIDEVAIYSGQLASARVQEHYRVGTVPAPSALAAFLLGAVPGTTMLLRRRHKI